MSIVGGFESFINNGYEHPPLGKFMLKGIAIETGTFVIRMLLFVVIL
jgi:hypothetical protein